MSGKGICQEYGLYWPIPKWSLQSSWVTEPRGRGDFEGTHCMKLLALTWKVSLACCLWHNPIDLHSGHPSLQNSKCPCSQASCFPSCWFILHPVFHPVFHSSPSFVRRSLWPGALSDWAPSRT
eukprot:1142135-Pelagomonas_calceolata.AAC.2